MRNRTPKAFATAAILALALTACGNGDGDDPVTPADPATNGTSTDDDTDGTDEGTAAADLSGSITVSCTADETLCAAWAQAFEAETGVTTNYVRLSSGEAVARFQAAGDNPEFDVWHAGPVDGFIAASAEGILEQYSSPNASDLSEDVIDPNGYWSGVYLGALGFCSNTERLEELGVEVPESWEDLLAPELQGEVMMAHPSTSGTAFTAVWTQVERLGGQDEALAFMRELNGSMLQYTRSGSAPAQAAGRGEVAVGIVFSHDCVSLQQEGFDALEVSFPSEGTGYEIGGVALLAGSQNPDAAKAYIDWALTPAAQDLGPENNAFQVLTHPDATDDERMVNLSDITLVDYDFEEAGAERSSITSRFDNEIAEEPAE
ncbi:MAG: ABC transporter substrate-binding protein [Actinomycetia bacterium]|nr:ABC transporter substrate-binding protein [Actinomycetes bacterium]